MYNILYFIICHKEMGPPTGPLSFMDPHLRRGTLGMIKKGRGRSGLIPVEDVLRDVFSRIEMPGELELKNRIFSAWDEVVPEAAAHARPFRFRGSTLLVEVASPVWLTELSMRKDDLIRRLEKVSGKKVVQDIRFEIKKKRRE